MSPNEIFGLPTSHCVSALSCYFIGWGTVKRAGQIFWNVSGSRGHGHLLCFLGGISAVVTE